MSGFAAMDGTQPPLVPPGAYEVAFVRHSTCRMFTRALKLILEFRIVTMGEHFGKPIKRYYNVRGTRKGGGFKVGHSSAFLRDYARLFGVPHRLDRIPMSRFEDHVFSANVRVVTHGSTQRPIPAGLTYSVISELVRVAER